MQGDERARRSRGLVAAMETAFSFVKTVPLLHSPGLATSQLSSQGSRIQTPAHHSPGQLELVLSLPFTNLLCLTLPYPQVGT